MRPHGACARGRLHSTCETVRPSAAALRPRRVVATFPGAGGITLGVCARHRCAWLDEIVADGDLTDGDVAMLTSSFLQSSTYARLL